jgi:diguanylate cyclase (GGDEF)-like protein
MRSFGSTAYTLCVNLVAVVGIVCAVGSSTTIGLDWGRFALLLAAASSHLFLSRAKEESRRYNMQRVHVDVTSIWTLAAALVLPVPLALLLLLVVRVQRWVVAHRPLYRYLTSTSVAVQGLFAVHYLLLTNDVSLSASIAPLRTTYGVIVIGGALVSYVLIQIVLIGVAAYLSRPNMTLLQAFGSRWDNQLEVTTALFGLVGAILLVEAPVVFPILIVVGSAFNRISEIEQLQVQARTDPKTQLFNMHGWTDLANRDMERAARSGAWVSVLMVDVDHFKLVNDTWGHPAGDEVLLVIAGCLRNETRPNDVVGRFGGEEFVVLLVEADADTAVSVAERIRLRIAKTELTIRDKRGMTTSIPGRTVSIGVVTAVASEKSLDALIHDADRAVYDAKAAGRNRISVAS